jgi:hypothetical protein
MERLHIVGDSHVSVFSGRDVLLPLWPVVTASLLPTLQPIHLGPVTAHNWKNDSSSSGGWKYFLEFAADLANKGSPILFSAGEIDCRAHLLKQPHAKSRQVAGGVEATIERYLEFLLRVRGDGFRISVLSPPATSFLSKQNPSYPFYGTEQERNAVTRLFTAALKESCAKNGIPFLDQFSFTVSPDNLTRRSFYWDGVHLGTTALPWLVSGMRDVFGLDLCIPLRWHLRERARWIKHRFWKKK